jgi:hypothetical protein
MLFDWKSKSVPHLEVHVHCVANNLIEAQDRHMTIPESISLHRVLVADPMMQVSHVVRSTSFCTAIMTVTSLVSWNKAFLNRVNKMKGKLVV